MAKLTNQDIFKLQEDLADEYKYKSLPQDKSEYYKKIWMKNLPKGLDVNGSDIDIYTRDGDLICSGYARIVIGDYGAFIEITPEQANSKIYDIEEGQEYRGLLTRYS